MGGLVLIPCILLFDKQEKGEAKWEKKEDSKTLLIGGICCGLALCATNAIPHINAVNTNKIMLFILNFFICFFHPFF